MFASDAGWTDVGALIVAIAALIQPWLIAIWKRYFRRGTVELQTLGNLEVGYSTFGPTLGIVGGVRSIHQDVFIKSVKAVVTRDDKAEVELEWRFLKPTTVTIPAPPTQTLEAAAGFVLLTSSSVKINALSALPRG
jgi:hypothetical protein